MLKLGNKGRILKALREKCQLIHNAKNVKVNSNLSVQTLKAKKAWRNVIHALRKNNCQPGIVYPAKLCFNIDEEIRTFPDKIKLKLFMSSYQWNNSDGRE
jgi:dissimilatory sulfite reductase (desulfoviridin) alpha/beta subunit